MASEEIRGHMIMRSEQCNTGSRSEGLVLVFKFLPSETWLTCTRCLANIMEGEEERVSQGFLTFEGPDCPENQIKTRSLSMENAHMHGHTVLHMISEGS